MIIGSSRHKMDLIYGVRVWTGFIYLRIGSQKSNVLSAIMTIGSPRHKMDLIYGVRMWTGFS
jgi:hypothetical protein